jgi:hypothetical protein
MFRCNHHHQGAHYLFLLTALKTVNLASSNNALPDDGVTAPKHVKRSCFNVNFNVNFKIVFKTIHLCISWWIKNFVKVVCCYSSQFWKCSIFFLKFRTCFIGVTTHTFCYSSQVSKCLTFRIAEADFSTSPLWTETPMVRGIPTGRRNKRIAEWPCVEKYLTCGIDIFPFLFNCECA